jgi:hypothetical protein
MPAQTKRAYARADMLRADSAVSWYSDAPARIAAHHSTAPASVDIIVRSDGNSPATPINPALGSNTLATHTASPAHSAVFGPAP